MSSVRPVAPRCHGIPVRFDAKFRGISNSRGIWRWQEIVVGPIFMQFDPREQQAMLLHEVGHCRARHLETRIKHLWLLLWDYPRIVALCNAQEFEADRFAARAGFGPDLARAFAKMRSTDTPLHPPLFERILRLSEFAALSVGAPPLTTPKSRAIVAQTCPGPGTEGAAK